MSKCYFKRFKCASVSLSVGPVFLTYNLKYSLLSFIYLLLYNLLLVRNSTIVTLICLAQIFLALSSGLSFVLRRC
jgi:hypothetical protein